MPPSAGRSGTRGSTCWTAGWSLCLRGLWGGFTLRVGGLRGAIWGVRGWGRGGLVLGGRGGGGADGGAVCCRPAWRRWRPDVPDRGFGALAIGRGAGVPGACGCAAQAARVPHRARRDRGCAGGLCGGGAGGGDRARGYAWAPAAGGGCGGGGS